MSPDPRLPEEISGQVERVTFHNPENGFAVLKVKIRGRRDVVAVLGEIPSIHAGEWLRAQGEWRRDAEHGLQFRAKRMDAIAPSTREGIERYLGSGLIKGIGPVYAKRLVERFGEDVFDIIDNHSARLESVDGIGKGRRQIIKSAWDAQKTVRAIMVFLHSHGVSSTRATRIYKTYGEEAIERIQSNPYILARDIRGIGFPSADTIAQKLGVAPDSLERAQAGLRHSLWEATNLGHCALPKDVLFEHASRLLDIERPTLERGLEGSLRIGAIESEISQGRELLFPPELRRAETQVAHHVRRLSQATSTLPEIDIDRAIPWTEHEKRVELATQQAEAIRAALRFRAAIITGGPGVGKTTMLRALLAILLKKRVRCRLLAPTGRAARRLAESTGRDATTIHRALEPKKGRFQRHAGAPMEGDFFVIDEASMIDVPLAASLFDALPKRAHLVLVGDIDQLPSVGPGRVLGDLIDSEVVSTTRLTEVFRQAADSRIVSAAHSVNAGRAPVGDSATGEPTDFYLIERETPERILQALLQVVTERAPKRFGLAPIQDIQVLCPMRRGSLGTVELNALLQNALNPKLGDSAEIERFGTLYRVGDKVIQTCNNYDKDVFNGDIGFIRKIDSEEQELEVQFDDRTARYEFAELDELGLAYAITVHKSQGSEFPAVVLPLSTQSFPLLQRNLVYTAITRGKRLVTVIGQSKALNIAVRNAESNERYSGLKARLLGNID